MMIFPPLLTRSDQEYQEFLHLGHGDIFTLEMDRCGSNPRLPRIAQDGGGGPQSGWCMSRFILRTWLPQTPQVKSITHPKGLGFRLHAQNGQVWIESGREHRSSVRNECF